MAKVTLNGQKLNLLVSSSHLFVLVIKLVLMVNLSWTHIFEQNIRAAEGIGLPVGVYFYSYANSIEQAIEQANWIATKLQNYTVELGVAFDWENWGDFNSAGMSFRTIRKVAETFLDRLDEHGYRGNLYSSKNYLEKFGSPISGCRTAMIFGSRNITIELPMKAIIGFGK